jgi:hypothetical protein
MEFCPYGGKQRYATRQEAADALRCTERRNWDGVKRQVYQCRTCHGWHFGENLRTAKRKVWK